MFCSNCGQQLPDHVNFCVRCGFKVRRLVTPAPAPVQTPAAVEPEYAQPVYAAAVEVTSAPDAVHIAEPAGADALAAQEEMVVENVYSPVEDQQSQEQDEALAYEARIAEAYELCGNYYKYDMEHDEESIESLYPRMKEIYEKMIPFKGLMIDPDYLDVTGTLAHLLTRYWLIHHWDIEAAAAYADNAVDQLGDYIARYDDTLDDQGKLRKRISYGLSCQYAAFCAYSDGYCEYTMKTLTGQPDSPNTLALRGLAQCLSGVDEKDAVLAHQGFSCLEQMDQKITAPAQGRFQTSIFTDAYLCYARMFAQYGSSFPEGEFKKDIPQALHLLARALTLIDDEAYTTKIINEIKDIADQY